MPTPESEPSPPLHIAGGWVIDPVNQVDGLRDLYVQGGRIVDTPPSEPCQHIDANGKLVLPGAIDMHTHVASRGVALARKLPELGDQLIGSPRDLAAQYLRMGYTTVIDAAVPPDESTLAHQMLDELPGLSAGFLLDVSDDIPLRCAVDQGEAAVCERLWRLLDESQAFGVKLVNPGRVDALDAPVPGCHATVVQFIRVLAAAIDRLNLPHALHLHTPRLGMPGNVAVTQTLLEQLGDHRLHLAHAQFAAYGQTEQGGFTSGVSTLQRILKNYPNVTCDAGCIDFGPAIMISRDDRLAQRLTKFLSRSMPESHGWHVAAMQYDARNPISALQWAMGLELLLTAPDLGRIALTVDHPNGGSCSHLIDLMKLLSNQELRMNRLQECHAAAGERTALPAIERQLSPAELLTITRTAPAAALGLAHKGHLSPGAAADVVITSSVTDPAELVICGGRVVWQTDRLTATMPGDRLRGPRLD